MIIEFSVKINLFVDLFKKKNNFSTYRLIGLQLKH